MTKILIIRFSSIGDILQCMSVIGEMKNFFGETRIHWLTRSDMASILRIDPRIDRIWELDRKGGAAALLKIASALRKERFTHIYDAHCNLRSALVKALLYRPSCDLFKGGKRLVTRHKHRLKRLLLFTFRMNFFPKPFKGAVSYLEPLRRSWGFDASTAAHETGDVYRFPVEVVERVEELLQPLRKFRWICLVPSAAWELKRWPVEYWKKLISIMPDTRFAVVGGPSDTFCKDICSIAPYRTVDLAGKISILESLYVIYAAPYIISGDTGLLHAADLFRKPGQALIGPTAFGFPSNDAILVTAVELSCRPCSKDGRGRCRNRIRKKCMLDITPETVKEIALDSGYV